MASNGTLKHVTTCMLPRPDGSPCGQQFIDSPLNVQIIGQPDQRAQKFVQSLAQHVGKKHPQQWAQISGTVMSLTGFLILMSFDTEDPALLESKGQVAAFLRFISRVEVSDEWLQELVDVLAAEFQEKGSAPIFQAFQKLRDQLSGIEEFRRNSQAQKPVLTP